MSKENIAEVHTAPFSLTERVNSGKLFSLCYMDTWVRYLFATHQHKQINLISDTWNYWGYGSDKNPETVRTSNQKLITSLGFLPSANLSFSSGQVDIGHELHFCDYDPEINSIITEAFIELNNSGYLTPGVINDNPGLYLNVEKVLDTIDFESIVQEIRVFPYRIKSNFYQATDPNNTRNQRGILPLTRFGTSGIPLQADLFDLESSKLYYDARFSPKHEGEDSISKPADKGETKLRVAPLVALNLLPFIRKQINDKSYIDFITFGTASALRFGYMSVLISAALGLDKPYEHLHTYQKLTAQAVSLSESTIIKQQDGFQKIRYLLFTQMTGDAKVIPEQIASIDNAGILSCREYDIFIKKIQKIASYCRQNNYTGFDDTGIPNFTEDEIEYLEQIHFLNKMEETDFSSAFRNLKEIIFKRTKEIQNGVNIHDATLIKTVKLFLPHISF